MRLSELSLDALFNGVSTFVPGTEVERIDFALSSPQSESTGVEEFIQRDETEQFKDLKKDDFKAAIGENKAWGITELKIELMPMKGDVATLVDLTNARVVAEESDEEDKF